MSARVFISYRSSDGADKATALSRDLDALFGQEQIFLDKEDLPAGSRWRDEVTRTLNASPILLVLVTPDYFDARDGDGRRCIERLDDPVRDELEVALAAGAHVIPLMCDGVAKTPPADDLPAPFDQLCERTWRKLRAYDWREDLGRLASDLRALGVVPRTTPGEFGPSPPLGDKGVPGATGGPPAGSASRRWALAAIALAVVAGGGVAAWRWQEAEKKKGPNLAGRWRASVGKRGATTSRDGEVVMVSIVQDGANLRIASSAVDIERDADWTNYRDFWKQRTGTLLTRVFYRGEGVIQSEDDTGVAAGDAPPGPQRILVSVRVDPPEGGEPIDTGALRGAIDPDGNRIRGRLWLSSERSERVVDLRREP